MAHIMYGSVEPMLNKTDDDWYDVASQVGKHVNSRASRSDIVAVVSETAGAGAPACFYPSLAEMHINTKACDLGEPDHVMVDDALWCWEHAPAVGAMDHEAAHAKHTHWDPQDLVNTYGATRKMLDVITTLEEPRIEAAALRERPRTRPFLRGCAMEIVAKDFHISDTRYGAATAAGLLLARVDAKVVDAAEVKHFRKAIRKVLGRDTLAALRPLWIRFLRLHDRDYAGMVDVAREWLDVLGEDPEDDKDLAGGGMVVVIMPPSDGEGSEGSGGGSGDSEDGEGEGEGSEGSGEGSEGAEGFGKAIAGMVREAATEVDSEIVEGRADERAARRRAEREADAKRRKESEGSHEEAFGPPSHGFTPGGFAHLTGTRNPTSDERRAARALARELEKIDYRDRAVTKVPSAVPPGRLRGGAAVHVAAGRSMGLDLSADEWRTKRRTRVDSTPLSIGFAVDISGSMSSAMKPLASTQWVVSTAGNHIDAKVSTVHFGESVHGIAPAGMRERVVREFYPGDGSEAFKDAALALDRELNLLDGSGARLLFVASDGHFVNALHAEYATTFMPLAARKGVAVVFLNFTGGCISYGAPQINCRGKSPVEVAAKVGKVATKVMRRMDRG